MDSSSSNSAGDLDRAAVDALRQQLAVRRERVALAQLCFSTTLFGACFVAQKRAMGDGMSPITFTAARYVVSLVFLLAVKFLLRDQLETTIDEGSRTVDSRSYSPQRMVFETVLWGGLCGLSSTLGSNLQQIGLVTVTAGKAAFYTALYVIVVPIVEWCLPGFGAKLNWRVWTSAVVSVVGTYLLSGCATDACFRTGGSASHWGDMVVIVSMFCWVFSIISCDVATNRGVDGLTFTIVEFGVCTVATLALSRALEPHAWVDIFGSVRVSWQMVIFCGVGEAMSFLFATLGQIYVDASKSAVIFSFESVVGALGGYFALGEMLDATELLGCVLMLSAVVFSTYDTVGASSKGDDSHVDGVEIATFTLPTYTPSVAVAPQPSSSSSSKSSKKKKGQTKQGPPTEASRLIA